MIYLKTKISIPERETTGNGGSILVWKQTFVACWYMWACPWKVFGMRTKNLLQDLELIPKEILHLKLEEDNKIMGEEPLMNQEEKKVWCYRKQETNKKIIQLTTHGWRAYSLYKSIKCSRLKTRNRFVHEQEQALFCAILPLLHLHIRKPPSWSLILNSSDIPLSKRKFVDILDNVIIIFSMRWSKLLCTACISTRLYSRECYINYSQILGYNVYGGSSGSALVSTKAQLFLWKSQIFFLLFDIRLVAVWIHWLFLTC